MRKRVLLCSLVLTVVFLCFLNRTRDVRADEKYTLNGIEVAGQGTVEYIPVEGIDAGYVGFDASTGMITYIKRDVTVANIPAKINGVKVKALADWALQNCESLKEVTFPDGIEVLGNGTLTETGIKEITIPGSVKSIGDWAFQDEPYLEKVVIEEGLTTIGQGCFRGDKALKTVELPSTLNFIDNYAFRNDDALEFLTLGGKEIDSFDDLEKAGVQFGDYIFGTAYAVHKDFSDSYKTGKWYKALHEVNITGDYVKDIFAIAESQYGYHEGNSFDEQHGNNTKGKGNYAEYNYWCGEPGTHWCGEFTGWCIAMASVPTELYDHKYLTDDDHQYKWSDTVYAGGKYELKKGDVILFLQDDGDHVVLVESVTKEGKKIIIRSRDGNNNNGAGTDKYTIDAATGRTLDAWVDANGHVETIYGPDWSKVKDIRFYTVTFDANGGKASMTSKKLSNGAYYGVMPLPVRSGYNFDGWYTAKEGGTKITSYRKAELSKDTTLYAHWTGNGKAEDTGSDGKVTITVSSKKIKLSQLKQSAQTVTITVQGSSGKVKYTNKTSKKLKAYVTVSKKGEVTLAEGAPKGTYKIKVTVAADGNAPKTVKTVKITVK